VHIGLERNLTDEQMPKILFIFTDMEFDTACTGTNETNYEAGKSLFESAGYSVPAIVFWNLRDSSNSIGTSTPVEKNAVGVSILSGFSGQMLSYIMNQQEDEESQDMEESLESSHTNAPNSNNNSLTTMTPLCVMEGIINNEKYNGLVVYE